MTKKASHRINFTMPEKTNPLNNKICELFERHSELRTLNAWIMGLVIKEAQAELREAPPVLQRQPKKVESFADLLEPDVSTSAPKAKSKELAAYDSLRDQFKKSGCDSSEWDEFFEKHKPVKLSDL